MSLTSKTVSGVLWSFIEQSSTRGISVLATLILAQFLTPEDYGLVATMAIFIAIANAAMDCGIREAVIRKLNPDESYYSTAFFTNILLGVASYVILFLATPFIASFYDDSRLVLLVRVAGIAVLINSFQSIQIAELSRALNFKTLLRASVPASAVSATVAVVMAWAGHGVWSLIAQVLISAVLLTLFLWWMQPWRPSLNFSAIHLKEMYGFGYKLFISGVLDAVGKNIYVLVIAKTLSISVAGMYFFAANLKDVAIAQFISSIQKVTYPALSTLQNDDALLKLGYRSVVQVTTFLMFPAMLMLAALAAPLFLLFFPSQWEPAIPYVQLMCIAGILHPLHSINLNILKAKGRSDLFLWLEIFKKTILLAILFISYRHGVTAILLGQCVQSLIAYLPNAYFSKNLIQYSVREQLSDVIPSLAIAANVSLLVFLISEAWNIPPLLEIMLLGGFGGALYIGLSWLFGVSAIELIKPQLMRLLFQSGDDNRI